MGDEKAPLIGDGDSFVEKCFGKSGFAVVQFVLVFTYLGLNTVLNIYNKYVLSSPEKNGAGLHTPLFMTCCHAVGCFFLAAIMTLFPSVYVPKKISGLKAWGKCAAMGAFFSMGVGFNNTSLVYIPLSLAQMIKSSHPALLAVLLYFLEGARYSKSKILAIVFIVLGISLSVMGSEISTTSVKGILFSFGSVISGAFYIAFLSMFLTGEERLKSFDMLLYVQPFVALILFPVSYMVGEIDKLNEFCEQPYGSSSTAIWLLGGGSLIAVIYNLTTMTFIKTLSAIYLSVTGTAKVALVIMLSVLFFGDTVTPVNALGTIIALAAFGFNSYLTYLEKTKNASS